MNGNATSCVFNLQTGSTLTLEKGIVIEIHYPKANANNIRVFEKNGELFNPNVSGLTIENDTANGLMRVTVTETVTIQA